MQRSQARFFVGMAFPIVFSQRRLCRSRRSSEQSSGVSTSLACWYFILVLFPRLSTPRATKIQSYAHRHILLLNRFRQIGHAGRSAAAPATAAVAAVAAFAFDIIAEGKLNGLAKTWSREGKVVKSVQPHWTGKTCASVLEGAVTKQKRGGSNARVM